MIKNIRQNAIDSIGVQAIHAIQDGIVLGLITGLSVTYPQLVTIISIVIFGDAIRPRKIIKNADDFIRTEHIKNNLEYFIIPYLAATGAGGGVGYVFSLYLGNPF